MIVPEAIIKALSEMVKPVNSLEVTQYILQKKYYDFTGKTPESTISAQLGDFLRKGDSRVKRFRGKGGLYYYYLAENENNIQGDMLQNSANIEDIKIVIDSKSNYDERDLHILLSTYLRSTGLFAKTIFHEQSGGKDQNQIWTHPDVVGVKFLQMQSKTTQKLLRAVDSGDSFKISSFEIKKGINSDNDLKKAFFQAVSNSSWANYGYLVTMEFSGSLMDEMARLNQSFGIGLIELKGNPYLSRVLFQPTYRTLDFRTIDKLCKMNPEFDKFIEHIQACLNAEERYHKASERELIEICDAFLKSEGDIEKYCKDKRIPFGIKDEVEIG